MLVRRYALYFFYFAMALNVVVGAAGLFGNDEDHFFRGMACTIILAFACLLIYPASWLENLKGGKHASWATMVWIIVLCVLSCTFAWVVDSRWGRRNNLNDILAAAWVTNILAGPVLCLALYLKRFASIRIASWTLFGCTAFFASLCFGGLVYDGIAGGRIGDRVAEASFTASLISLLIVLILGGRWRWYKIFGIVSAIVAMVFVSLDMTRIMRMNDDTGPWFVLSLTLACVWAHGNVLWQLPLKDGWPKLMRTLVQLIVVPVVGVVIYGCILILIEESSRTMLQNLVKFGGSDLFVCLSLTFVLILKAAADQIKLNKAQHENQFNYAQLQIKCPHCQAEQLLTQTGQSCRTCGLQFKFSITEPHCPSCDYLIIGQADGSCPECGHAIEPDVGEVIALA